MSTVNHQLIAKLLSGCSMYWQQPSFCLFACLGFNSTFSTNRLYRAIKVGKYVMQGQETTQIHNKTMK